QRFNPLPRRGKSDGGKTRWCAILHDDKQIEKDFFRRRCPNGCGLFVVFIQSGGRGPAPSCETVGGTIMAKFLCIYREPTEKRGKPSPEEMQAAAAAWQTWMRKFSAAILPGDDGLKRTGRLLKAGLVTDGPYAEAKEIIASFGVIQADNYD